MSSTKRRNHYVPRVLLRRFASRVDGKKSWVWQVSKDERLVEVSTRDAAVGTFFYGSSESGVEDALGSAETQFGAILGRIDAGESVERHREELRHFVYLLFIRTKALRDQFIQAADAAVGKFVQSASQDRVGRAVRAELNKSIDEHLAKATSTLPKTQGNAVLAIAKNPKLREALKAHIASEIGTVDVSALLAIFEGAFQGRLPEAARNGQIRGLDKLLTETHTPESFSPDHWVIRERNAGRFILGDCCAIAQSADGQHGSILKLGKAWQAVLLPISPQQLLIGHREGWSSTLDEDAIDRASAQLSRSYIYSSEGTKQVRRLADYIGDHDALLSEEDLESMMDDVWG